MPLTQTPFVHDTRTHDTLAHDTSAHDIHARDAAQRFIIAGGPGSGKSTLLHALVAAGELCYEEASRVLIREQLAQSGRLLPWSDLWGFAQECGVRMQAQLGDSAHRGRCFFDRGLPDLIGYLSHGRQSAPDAWRAACRNYARVAFFAPPWREIYVNDAERPQTFTEAQDLSTHIRRAYLDCGFRLVELVIGSVADRLAQVRFFIDTIRKDSCINTRHKENGHG